MIARGSDAPSTRDQTVRVHIVNAQALTARYLQIVAFSGPPMTVMLVGTTCLRAAGETAAGMYILLVVNAVNIGLSWLLTVGWGPIPAFGWEGIAAGTSASFFVGGLATVGWLLAGRSTLRLHAGDAAEHDPRRRRHAPRTASWMRTRSRSSAGRSARRSMFGPSLGAESGFSCTSRNRPSTPQATAARAR
mgnify:CR=1 FL=1